MMKFSTTRPIKQTAKSSLGATCLLTALLSVGAHASTVVVAFDFENTTEGSTSALASTIGPGITGALFDGSRTDANVLTFTDNIFTSAGLVPNSGGTEFSFFRFTTANSLDLESISFTAGQNDNEPSIGNRAFQVRISPVGTVTPTGKFGTATSGWDLLANINIGFGFGDEASPNFDIDLTGRTLAPGTYHIAFGAQSGVISNGSTQLFMDNVTLNQIPEPSSIAMIALGFVSLCSVRRRRIA